MTKDKKTWLAIAALAIFGAGFVLALAITKAPSPSAAVTVRRTLLGLTIAPVALGGGFVALKRWWERRGQVRRLEETLSLSSKVIDPQVRANLTTAIAFQTRTYIESKVILGCKGAEDLRRPGQALTFIGGRWEKVQVLRIEPERVSDFISEQVVVERPALSEIEAALVRHALEELDGAFIINRLYEDFKGRISRRRLVKLGRQWEQRGWLTEPRHAADPRRVTDELLALIPPAPGGANGSHDHTDHTR